MNDQELKIFKKRDEITAWLDRMEIKNYKIQTDFTVDLRGGCGYIEARLDKHPG